MGQYPEKGTTSGHIKLWDVSSWRVLHDLRGHSGCVYSVAFNAFGTRLATGSGYWQTGKGNGQAKIWDVVTGLELLTLADHNECVYGVAFSPNGHRLATADRGGIRVWSGKPFLIDKQTFKPLPDGQTLVE